MQKYNNREIQYLTLRLEDTGKDNDIINVSLASSSVVNRGFYTEQLVITKEAINLDRAVTGLPLLYQHDASKIIGRVNDIRIDAGKLRGDLVFSNNDIAQSVLTDIRDGFLQDMSIGYRGDETVEVVGGYRLDKWTLYEASVVTIPADIGVGINRANNLIDEGKDMDKAEAEKISQQAVKDYQDAQSKRCAEITTVFANFSGQEYVDLRDTSLADSSMTVDQVRQSLLDMVGRQSAAGAQSHSISITVDEHDKFRSAVTDTLLVKTDNCRDDKVIADIRSNEFHSMSMVEIARQCLVRAGITVGGSRMEILGNAMSMRAAHVHGVVDFPGILENIANKAMQLGYEEAGETWALWAKTGNLADFKLSGRPNLSAFDTLPIVPDKAEYTSGAFEDLSEHIQLATYGKLFDISRQALINDDVSGLSGIPRAMGRAATRTVGDLAYSILTLNAAMDQDGAPVFDATHNNIVTSAVPGVDEADIKAMKLAMALQTDPSDNAVLGIRPGYFLMPTSMADDMRVLMAAKYQPGSNVAAETPNPLQGMAAVVEEHRLESFDPDQYYAVANPAMSETVEIAFLDGVNSPTLEQDDPFTRDGVTFKVRIDAGGRALEYRGMQRIDTTVGTFAMSDKERNALGAQRREAAEKAEKAKTAKENK